MGVIEQVAKSLLKQAVVTEVSQIARHTYHLTIADDSLRNLDFIPGQTLKVFIGLNDNMSVTEGDRTYSVWNYDAVSGVIDLAICTFSKAAGTDWIAKRKKGDMIYFVGPSGKFIIDYDARYYFFAGDTTALGHFYQLSRALKNKSIAGLIHMQDKQDGFADIDGTWPLDLQVSEPGAVPAVIRKIETTGFHLHAGDGLFYAAGSPSFCKELNHLFRHKYNWPASRIKTKPFWK